MTPAEIIADLRRSADGPDPYSDLSNDAFYEACNWRVLTDGRLPFDDKTCSIFLLLVACAFEGEE